MVLINHVEVIDRMSEYKCVHSLLGRVIMRVIIMASIMIGFSFNANASSLSQQCKLNEKEKYLTFFESGSKENAIIDGLIYIVQYEEGLSFILNVPKDEEDRYFRELEK